MNGAFKALAVVIAVAVATHLAVIFAAPYAMMGIAMSRISQHGKVVNAWTFPPRTTERSRAIVRPSPDLAYASCVYDLAKGPVRIKVTPSGDYTSLSIFQANSDNIYAVNDRQAPNGVDLLLVRKDAKLNAPPGVTLVRSPTRRGIILDRRLAPTAEAFAVAVEARKADVCASAGAG